MLPSNFMRHWQRLKGRCVRSGTKRQRLDYNQNGLVCRRVRRFGLNIGNDVTGYFKLGVLQARSQARRYRRRVRFYDPKRDDMAFSSECQRLPVDRADFAKQYPIAVLARSGEQGTDQPRSGTGERKALHRAASRKARTRRTVSGLGSRPLRRSNTNRGSPMACRPNRVGGISLIRRKFSTFRSKSTGHVLVSGATRLHIKFQRISYLSRELPIIMDSPC